MSNFYYEMARTGRYAGDYDSDADYVLSDNIVLRFLAQYPKAQCLLCDSGDIVSRHEIRHIIPPNDKGCNQLRWLKAAAFPCSDDINSLDNLIPLCNRHAEWFVSGTSVLVPSLEDLQTILEWSKKSEHSRDNEDTPDKEQLSIVPPPSV
ncbi:hypothetical protein GY45DRAFT_154213 [Cubamyces sp. BRFM 1775]|nr:hypothetical protein GY45DRAFT_154213 [Cubamyces sp. BRFM 1775]